MRKIGRRRVDTLAQVTYVSPEMATDTELRAIVEREATARLGPISEAGWLAWRALGPARIRWVDDNGWDGPALVIRQPWEARFIGRRPAGRAGRAGRTRPAPADFRD